MVIKIQYKIIFLFTTIIVFLVLFTYFQINNIIRSNFKKYSESEVTRYGQIVSSFIVELMNQKRQNIKAFASIAELNQTLLNIVNQTDQDSIFKVPFLLNKYRSDYDFDSFRLYNPSGGILGEAGVGTPYENGQRVNFMYRQGDFSGIFVDEGQVFFTASSVTVSGNCLIVGRTRMDSAIARKIRNTTGVHIMLYRGTNRIGDSLGVSNSLNTAVEPGLLEKSAAGTNSVVDIEKSGLTLLYSQLRDHNGKTIGSFVLAISSGVLIATSRQAQNSLIIIVIIGAALTMVIGFLFARQLTVPLNKLMQWAHKISQGDLDFRIPIRSNDEIRELGALFDTMTTNLKRSFEKIQAQNVELTEANIKLTELDKLKTDFLSTISHELKTPLTSILGFAKIVQKKQETALEPLIRSPDPKQQRSAAQMAENVNIIITESEKLFHLIKNVLALTSMLADKVDWKSESFDLNAALESVLAAYPGTQGTVLKKEMSKGELVCTGDKEKICLLMDHLLSNAFKFTSAGAVTVSTVRKGRDLVIRVRDTGIGISPENHEKVFDMFRQVGDVLTEKPQGIGLGLAISRLIAKHHNGTISVESREGAGSLFTVCLPASTGGAEG